jgi:hypothetical protein
VIENKQSTEIRDKRVVENKHSTDMGDMRVTENKQSTDIGACHTFRVDPHTDAQTTDEEKEEIQHRSSDCSQSSPRQPDVQRRRSRLNVIREPGFNNSLEVCCRGVGADSTSVGYLFTITPLTSFISL